MARLFGKLSDINNGKFEEEFHSLFRQARKENEQARFLESKEKEKSIEFYEKSIGALVALDDLYENNEPAIRWSVAKGMTMKAIYYLGWVIALAYTVARYWDRIMNYFH